MTESPVAIRLRQMMELFNRGSLDVPDGLFDRQTIFRLNGTAYHESLGRPEDDPLIRMIGCGPAAYRFNAMALQHAFETLKITLDTFENLEREADGLQTLTAVARLRGRLRDEGAFEGTCGVTVRATDRACVKDVEVTMSEDDLGRIKAARARG